MANLRQPHISVTRYETPRTAVQVEESNATVLFVPFISAKGPAGKLQKIFSVGQFVSEYGTPDFSRQGQTILNIYNWLNAGGAILAYRIVGTAPVQAISSTTKLDDGIIAKAKNVGAYFNGLSLKIRENSRIPGNFSVTVLMDNVVQKTYVITEETASSIMESTIYFETFEITTAVLSTTISTALGELEVTFSGGDDKAFDSVSSLDSFVTGLFTTVNADPDHELRNKLFSPIDMILDAGYSTTTKTQLSVFASHRDDIMVVLDSFDLGLTEDSDKVVNNGAFSDTFSGSNIALYDQKLYVRNSIAESGTKEIRVTPTYFLAQLFPTNDAIYGMQWPTAGLTRGVLNGIRSIDLNPSTSQKEDFYLNKVNYIEKDSRGYTFMSQLTKNEEYTALSYINNSRVINRIQRDVESIGRRYLHEFNDGPTLTLLKGRLEKYLGEWVQNRTLNFALVSVEADPLYDNVVNVGLEVKFTGTIEIISVDIVIQ
jgi:hypothetical protein